MAPLRILCLVGSPTSDFFRELSELYAGGCLAALGDLSRFAFTVLHISPGPVWRLPESLSPDSILAAPILTFGEAMAELEQRTFDVALPQMFCLAGMTTYRALLETLGLPYLGNRPAQMAISADKALARSIVAAAGVNVPPAELLRPGETPAIAPPVVVKPCRADNSDGVSLVTDRQGYPAALTTAFGHDDAVLVERYIDLGREVRCGVLQRGKELIALPLEEYRVDPVDRPIRTAAQKLRRASDGKLELAAKAQTEAWIVDAADPIVERVQAAAKCCHIALGCRHYGLFDFRIDRDGHPWFLESGPYCSFSPGSVIATMAAAAGIPLDVLFDTVVTEALGSPP